MSEWKLCKECGQPMKPKEVKKRPNEFDHAQGCSLDRKKAKETTAVRCYKGHVHNQPWGQPCPVCERDNLLAENEQLRARVGKLTAALRDMVIRFTGLFDAYARPTYHKSSHPDDDLDLSLIDARAVLALTESPEAFEAQKEQV